ncbi:MAG: hypothetical protein ABEJ75_03720 [Candidatus Nanohaloarchaea archaeon]
MGLARVLSESFELLEERPRLFAPKIFSTSVSTVWMLGLLNSIGQPSYLYYAAALPFLVVLGVAVSVMVAAMVDSDRGLKDGFRATVNRWKTVLKASALFLVTGLLFSLPMSAGFILYMLEGNITALVAGSALSLAAVLALSFGVYFLPITIVKNRSFLKSLTESVSTSTDNSREVGLLLMFSLALLGFASLTQGIFRGLGYAGFAAGRLLSAIVTTYLFVVSPKYYLS